MHYSFLCHYTIETIITILLTYSGENTHILPVLDTVYYEDEENIVNGYVQTQVDKDLYTSAIETKSPKWNDAKIIILDVVSS